MDAEHKNVTDSVLESSDFREIKGSKDFMDAVLEKNIDFHLF